MRLEIPSVSASLAFQAQQYPSAWAKADSSPYSSLALGRRVWSSRTRAGMTEYKLR